MTSPVFTARVPFTAPQIGATYDPQQMRTALNGIARAIPPTVTRSVTANTKIAATDDTLLVDTTAGNITVTLLPANQVQFLRLQIKNIGTSTVILSGTVDGVASPTIPQQSSLVLQSDGVAWRRLNLPNDRVYNVFDYGAIGNGNADDTAAIQRMFDAAGVGSPFGAIMLLPPQFDYKVTGPLTPPAFNAFINSSKHTIRMDGARIFSYDTTPGRAILDCSGFIGQEGCLTIEGGTLDGANATATTNGYAIHSGNVKLDRVVARYCNYGVTYINDLAGPPICSELSSCYLQLNTKGIYATVPVSNLYVHGCRIEGNDEEGVYLDGCGKICFTGNTIENNGFVTRSKPNFKILNAVDGLINGNYFESTGGQIHTSIDLEGKTLSVNALVFTGNRVVGGSSSGDPLSIALNIGSTGGGVEGVCAFGNEYVGQTTAVRIGTNARGCSVGPDYFSDNFNPAGLNHTRYSVVSTQANQVNDFNRYGTTSTLYSARIVANGGLQVTGGTSGAGTITKDASLGLSIRLVNTGATSDFAIQDFGGSAIYEVPHGTLVSQFFASVQEKTATIAYSASMTPDGSAGNLQKITATDGVAFTINAPTNPRTGIKLRIRIRNITAGALGAVTWDAVYKLAAWVSPSNGFSRVIEFDYDGTNWVEFTRSAADIPN